MGLRRHLAHPGDESAQRTLHGATLGRAPEAMRVVGRQRPLQRHENHTGQTRLLQRGRPWGQS